MDELAGYEGRLRSAGLPEDEVGVDPPSTARQRISAGELLKASGGPAAFT